MSNEFPLAKQFAALPRYETVLVLNDAGEEYAGFVVREDHLDALLASVNYLRAPAVPQAPAKTDRWLKWLLTAKVEDVVMTIAEDGSTLDGIQEELRAALAARDRVAPQSPEHPDDPKVGEVYRFGGRDVRIVALDFDRKYPRVAIRSVESNRLSYVGLSNWRDYAKVRVYPDGVSAPPTPQPPTPRNEWRLDDRGCLDDVVVDDVATFRIERMSDDHIWGAVYRRDGSRTHFDIFGDRVSLTHEDDTPAPPLADPPPQE